MIRFDKAGTDGSEFLTIDQTPFIEVCKRSGYYEVLTCRPVWFGGTYQTCRTYTANKRDARRAARSLLKTHYPRAGQPA